MAEVEGARRLWSVDNQGIKRLKVDGLSTSTLPSPRMERETAWVRCHQKTMEYVSNEEKVLH